MEQQLIKTAVRAAQSLQANFTPFMDWAGQLKDPETLKADLFAGLSVALVLVPQSMAYAQLGGLPPYYGLYASFLPVAVAALFGSSRQLGTGPVAIVSLLSAAALGPIATDMDTFVAYSIALALIVGLFQLALGLVRLGGMVAFLSHPVVIGFTNAAALVIATSQLAKIFGVSVEQGDYHFETVWRVVLAAVEDTHWLSLVMALSAAAIMWPLMRFFPRIPGILIGVSVTTVASWLFGFEDAGGAVVGDIPEGLPPFNLPSLSFAAIAQLSGTAIAIALIGFTEAASVGKAMAITTRQKLDADQELIGQGLANIVSSMSHGCAVAGSFSRSAVNLNAGAKTGFSSVVAAAVVGLTLLLLTPLFYHLPQPTLAAVIMLAVGGLIRVGPVRQAWRVHPHDGIVSIVTFVLTLIYAPHLENGILTGVLLSLGLYVYRTMHPHASVLARAADGTLRDAGRHILKLCPRIAIIRFEGPLFFASTGHFESQVLTRIAAQPDLRFIIIDAVAMHEIDASGEHMLHNLTRYTVEHGIEFLFARVPEPIMETFRRSGFVAPEWEDRFQPTREEALQYAWREIQKRDGVCPECSSQLENCVLRPRGRTADKNLLQAVYGQFVKTAPKPATGAAAKLAAAPAGPAAKPVPEPELALEPAHAPAPKPAAGPVAKLAGGHAGPAVEPKASPAPAAEVAPAAGPAPAASPAPATGSEAEPREGPAPAAAPKDDPAPADGAAAEQTGPAVKPEPGADTT